jgi:hypothetical protein
VFKRLVRLLSTGAATAAVFAALASSASAAPGCSGSGPQVHDPFTGRSYASTYCHVYSWTQTYTVPNWRAVGGGSIAGVLRPGRSWFVCQTRGGENMPLGNARNNIWLYTLADVRYVNGGWGWADAVSISGGTNYQRIPGLHWCDRPKGL